MTCKIKSSKANVCLFVCLLRGEEQNREEGKMAQKKLGGGRKRKVGSREN